MPCTVNLHSAILCTQGAPLRHSRQHDCKPIHSRSKGIMGGFCACRKCDRKTGRRVIGASTTVEMMPSLGLRSSQDRHPPITPYTYPLHLSITTDYRHSLPCVTYPVTDRPREVRIRSGRMA